MGILEYLALLFKRAAGENSVAAVHKAVKVYSAAEPVRQKREYCRSKNCRAAKMAHEHACSRPNSSDNRSHKRENNEHK